VPTALSTFSRHEATRILLKSYEADREATVGRLRVELGFALEDAAALFAIIVFLSEGLIDFCSKERVRDRFLIARRTRDRRFLRILGRLPMELQMRLCCLTFELDIPHLLSDRTEHAFSALAGLCLHMK